MVDVSRYKLTCDTCGTVDDPNKLWGTTPPTKCPNDDGHVIDSDSVTVVEKTVTRQVQVRGITDLTGYPFFRMSFKFVPTAWASGDPVVSEHAFKVTAANWAICGGGYALSGTPDLGDFLDMKLVDKDNVRGYGADFVLAHYVITEYLPGHANAHWEYMSQGANAIPQNTYLVVYYTSVNTSPVDAAMVRYMFRAIQ